MTFQKALLLVLATQGGCQSINRRGNAPPPAAASADASADKPPVAPTAKPLVQSAAQRAPDRDGAMLNAEPTFGTAPPVQTGRLAATGTTGVRVCVVLQGKPPRCDDLTLCAPVEAGQAEIGYLTPSTYDAFACNGAGEAGSTQEITVKGGETVIAEDLEAP